MAEAEEYLPQAIIEQIRSGLSSEDYGKENVTDPREGEPEISLEAQQTVDDLEKWVTEEDTSVYDSGGNRQNGSGRAQDRKMQLDDYEAFEIDPFLKAEKGKKLKKRKVKRVLE